ncbi:MAG: biosynthetic peptidoglycan transglycosylase [Daejeonella sp.]
MKRFLFLLFFTRTAKFLPFSNLCYNKIKNKIFRLYHLEIDVYKAKFTIFNSFVIENLKIKNRTSKRTTEIKIEKIEFALCFKSLLKGKAILKYLNFHKINISTFSVASYIKEKTSENLNGNLKNKIRSYYDLIFKRYIKYSTLFPNTINCKGVMISSNSEFILASQCVFDFSLERSVETYFFQIKTNISGCNINLHSISTSKINNQDFKFDLKGQYDENGFIIDKVSSIYFNDLCFSFYIQHLFATSDLINSGIILKECTANEISRTLQSILINDIYPSNFTGHLSAFATLTFELNNPLKHIFKVKVNNKLEIRNSIFPKFNLTLPFLYKIYLDGKVIKEIMLSNENSHFASLKTTSKHLLNTILSTEDPYFLIHKGIDVFGLGYAITTNIAQRKFVRGGSTITMQLARNLFLNHERTISRKIEEIIITLLLENVLCTPKQELLEIYLNVIEFGKDLYGISEATDFYFEKKPQDITLTESLVISYIIPRPKFFLEALEMRSPQLIMNLNRHFVKYSEIMLKKGLISKIEFDNISYRIEFKKELGILILN